MQIPFETKPQIREWEFVVLLFYKYVRIDDPAAFLAAHRELCERLGIKGRYIVAHEGLNGTCEGTPDAVNAYVQELTSDERFADMHIKYSKGTGNAFPKLKIKVRPEIVSLGLGENDIDPNVITGTHLKPAELHQWFENGEDFTIIDMRNDYEHAVGHFPNSVLPKLKNFRDLPKELPNLDPYKTKRVITVCTGGVRCEKASGYLKTQGFTDVYQLDGGMVSYMEQFPGQNFNGAMYSFDGRNVVEYYPPKLGFVREDKIYYLYVNCNRHHLTHPLVVGRRGCLHNRMVHSHFISDCYHRIFGPRNPGPQSIVLIIISGPSSHQVRPRTFGNLIRARLRAGMARKKSPNGDFLRASFFYFPKKMPPRYAWGRSLKT